MPGGEGAPDIIGFEGVGGSASRLRYDVEMPGGRLARRLIQVAVPNAAWAESARTAGVSWAEAVGMEAREGGPARLDDARLLQFIGSRYADAVAGLATAPVDPTVSAPLEARSAPKRGSDSRKSQPEALLFEVGDVGPVPPGKDLPPEWLGALAESKTDGKLRIPIPGSGGTVRTAVVDPSAPPQPVLYLVEVYGISSSLGDYGLGKTVKTYSLFPGEEAEISVRTWRSSSETATTASSIVDSYDQSATDRFQSTLTRETSESSSDDSTNHWEVAAHGGLDLGIVSFGAQGGGSGDSHSARADMARSVGEAVQEHTKEASAAREMAVSSTSERSSDSGEETQTTRTIKNLNVRRVLNFVFRELNQQYSVRVHLKDIRVAFTNGQPGSSREVPISGLGRLLRDLIPDVPTRSQVATAVVTQAALVFDYRDNPVHVLEKVTMQAGGENYQVTPGNPPYALPIDGSAFYRFRRGALTEGEATDGVVVEKETVTLRTDSLLVEALLGEADALDDYAMQIQREAARAKTLANEREVLGQATLQLINDGKQRAGLFPSVFPPPVSCCRCKDDAEHA